MEKLGFFAFEGVSNELQDPANDEGRHGVPPERVKEDAGYGHSRCQHDQRNAKGMAKTVDRVSMAASILRDPLLAGASAHDHGRIIADT